MGFISNVVATKWKSGEFGKTPNWLARNTLPRILTGGAIAAGVGYHVYSAISDYIYNPVAGFDELTYPLIAGAAVIITAVTAEYSAWTVKPVSVSAADKTKIADKKKAAAAKAAADKLDADLKAAEEAAVKIGSGPADDFDAAAKQAPTIDFLAGIDFSSPDALDLDSPESDERQTEIYQKRGRGTFAPGDAKLAAGQDQVEEPTEDISLNKEVETMAFRPRPQQDAPKPEAKQEPKPAAKPEQDDELAAAEKTRLASVTLYPAINALLNALDPNDKAQLNLRKRITKLMARAIEGKEEGIKALNDQLEEMNATGAITEELLANAQIEAAGFIKS